MSEVHPANVICPACGADNDVATGIANGDIPAPALGDAAICFMCATILIFDGEPLTLRFPKPEEADIYANRMIAQARCAVIDMRTRVI